MGKNERSYEKNLGTEEPLSDKARKELIEDIAEAGTEKNKDTQAGDNNAESNLRGKVGQ